MLDADLSSYLHASEIGSAIRWWAIGRLIVITTVFGLITKYHLIKIWSRYNAKKAMTIHTAVALLEVMKFTVEDVFRDPVPSAFDLLVATVHNASAAALSAPLQKGNRQWTRPSFQANVVIRVALSLFAYYAQSAGAHRTACFLNHGAIYIRIGITSLKFLVPSYSNLYTAVSLTSGVICFETGSYESGFMPQGTFLALTAILVPLVKWTSDLNADLELDDPVILRMQSQLAAEKSTAAPQITLAPIQTDFADHIASPGTPRQLTLSALQELDAALSPLSTKLAAASTSETTPAGSTSPGSPAHSDDLALLTPQAETVPLIAINDGLDDPSHANSAQTKPKLSLAPLNTSFTPAERVMAASAAPWSALLRSPSSAFPFANKDRATVKKELRILAARAGLSPLKEWQDIRRWDRARAAAAKTQ